MSEEQDALLRGYNETTQRDDEEDMKQKTREYGSLRVLADERWDFVLVFPELTDHEMNQLPLDDRRDEIVLRLHAAGLETKLFYSHQKRVSKKSNEVERRVIFCKVRASRAQLRVEAERMQLRLPLNPVALQTAAENGLKAYNIRPFPIRDPKHIVKYPPYEYIYAPYMRDEELQCFYQRSHDDAEDDDELFSSTDRLMIVEHMITCHTNGAGCDLDRLMYDKALIVCFPLHEDQTKRHLQHQWLQWSTAPLDQPFESIRNYFGVKVALYFLYLGHSTHWLTSPALVGVLVWLVMMTVPASDHPFFAYVSPLFGAFMTIWMTVYLEDWKRVNADASLRWGTLDHEHSEQLRPQFVGESIASPIDRRPTRYFSRRDRLQRLALSWCVIGLLCLIVCALVSSIFYLRYDLTKGTHAAQMKLFGHAIGPTVAAIANVVQITIMTKIYNAVANYLNDQENHRTQIEYENAFIIKTVLFQFVNNYAGLFYVAFLKHDMEGCDAVDGNCMDELAYLLAFVFGSRLVLGNLNELLLPRFWTLVARYQLFQSLEASSTTSIEALALFSAAEKELFLAAYDWRGTFDDYTENVLQFGFMSMFVVALPLAPLLSYINNYIEIRLDAFRLLHETRRPRPQNVADIGYWYYVLQAIAAISICTNGGVVIFTGTYFTGASTAARVWYFTLFVSSMFFFKYVLEALINDTPASVAAQRQRQAFLVNKCLYHVRDERVTSITRPHLSSQQIQSIVAIADAEE